MESDRRTFLVVAAAMIVAAAATVATSANARDRRLAHPPIHVATPGRGPITPYFFPYGSRYRYNSAGPVYYQLADWGPTDSCRVWRYNYLYWTC
jgi:hypothetical protein